MSPLKIHTRRLTLRPLCPGDAARIAQHLNNFAVAGNLSRVPYPYFEDDAAAFLALRQVDLPPEDTEFAIDLGDHGLIGSVGYHERDGQPVLGYYLGQPYWGRGLMTEAARAAVSWFFSVTGREAIYSGAFAFNKPSLTVQKKLGFTQTGRSTLLCLARNEQVRHIDTKLTRDAWTGTVR
jgi:RimJ/RimL family protein N-acetyltransferase